MHLQHEYHLLSALALTPINLSSPSRNSRGQPGAAGGSRGQLGAAESSREQPRAAESSLVALADDARHALQSSPTLGRIALSARYASRQVVGGEFLDLGE